MMFSSLVKNAPLGSPSITKKESLTTIDACYQRFFFRYSILPYLRRILLQERLIIHQLMAQR